MKQENDAQLIDDILSGDDAAFNTLVEKYQKSVHALVWRKIGDFHYAEEITQDTFLQAYKKLSTLKHPHMFAGWLYVIANRLSIKWLREQKPVPESLETIPVNEIEESSYRHYVSEQEDINAIEGHRELVRRLLEKLPDSERTVMTLYYLGEMTTKEIGKLLGVSVHTITSRLQRARKRLQRDEEHLVQKVLGGVQISARLSENIMRAVAEIETTSPPVSKPLLPWAAFGAAAVLIVLLLGTSNQYLARFQKPYNFEAQSEPTIEIIDTPVTLDIDSKPDVRNQIGAAAFLGKSNSTGLQTSETPLQLQSTWMLRSFLLRGGGKYLGPKRVPPMASLRHLKGRFTPLHKQVFTDYQREQLRGRASMQIHQLTGALYQWQRTGIPSMSPPLMKSSLRATMAKRGTPFARDPADVLLDWQ